MKNVLLLVHDDPGQEARLQTALDLVRALEGHLICLDVTEVPILYGEPFAISAAQTQLAAEMEARESANRARIEARLAGETVPWTWLDKVGAIVPSVEEAAKMADVIVVNRRLDSAAIQDMRAVAAELIVGSGRLVVAVPEQSRGLAAADPALVAWDGSNEATNALRAAVPLLALAGSVTILEIDDGSVETPAEEAAAYLSRHGIEPLVVRRTLARPTVADEIRAEAELRDAGYVVMGGFGRSRLAESLFGGISRDMLTDSPVPTLMAH